MIVVDTNVLSELMRPSPARRVLAWFSSVPAARLHVTTITIAEMLTGVTLLPRGRRRDALDVAVRRMVDEDFAGRTLAFDQAAATHYADVVAARTRAGHPIATLDAQIAAIARSRGASLATRNVADFEGCEVDLIDPFR
jgi:hypothetical protein